MSFSLPYPWLDTALRELLATHRGHAVLLAGPQGVGQFELALALAQAWLCESDAPAKPCGVCPGCALVRSHTHPDLVVLLPEALQEELGWGSTQADAEAKASKAKPSREIKVDALRRVVEFAQQTSSRGVAKVVLVHPAERMNAISANTLLKTLEEPPGQARFVLSTEAIDALLPTIRSRCQHLRLSPPDAGTALQWLQAQGMPQADVLLGRAAGDGAAAEAAGAGRGRLAAAAGAAGQGRPRGAGRLAGAARGGCAAEGVPRRDVRGRRRADALLLERGFSQHARQHRRPGRLVARAAPCRTSRRAPLERRTVAGVACEPGAPRLTLGRI
jgi:DNA polymerase III delta' subunit